MAQRRKCMCLREDCPMGLTTDFVRAEKGTPRAKAFAEALGVEVPAKAGLCAYRHFPAGAVGSGKGKNGLQVVKLQRGATPVKVARRAVRTTHEVAELSYSRICPCNNPHCAKSLREAGRVKLPKNKK